MPFGRVQKAVLQRVLPPALQANHVEYSMIASSEDEGTCPTERLLTIGLEAAIAARQLRLEMPGRDGRIIPTMDHWPGEHYRLLAGLVEVLKPKVVIEVGTGSGGSAAAMKTRLPRDGKVVTFDPIPWEQVGEGMLQAEDFADGRLVQFQDDVTSADGLAKHRVLFESADLIFIDAAKDGMMEQRLIDLMRAKLTITRAPVLVFDDIRLWNMLRIWRHLPWPKLDLTSFGHWTGTGLAEWRSLT